MKKITFSLGFFVGLAASTLLCVYLLGMFCFVFQDETVGTMGTGLIAYAPKWIFLFCPLVLLNKTKEVKEILEKIINLLA